MRQTGNETVFAQARDVFDLQSPLIRGLGKTLFCLLVKRRIHPKRVLHGQELIDIRKRPITRPLIIRECPAAPIFGSEAGWAIVHQGLFALCPDIDELSCRQRFFDRRKTDTLCHPQSKLDARHADNDPG